MAEQQDLERADWPIKLLLNWDRAWEKYKGRIGGVGALPGIALVEAADLLGTEGWKLRQHYWLSGLRTEVCLAFRKAEAEEWLVRASVPLTAWSYSSLGEAFTAVCGEFSASEDFVQNILRSWDGPDLWWWARSMKGEGKVLEIAELIREAPKGPLGFRKPE